MFEKKGRVRDSMLSVFLLEFFLCSNYLHKTSSSLYPFKFLFNSQVESKLLIFLYVTTTLPVYKVRSSRFRVCLYVTVQVREGPERLRPCYPLHQSFNPTVVCPYRMLRSSPWKETLTLWPLVKTKHHSPVDVTPVTESFVFTRRTYLLLHDLRSPFITSEIIVKLIFPSSQHSFKRCESNPHLFFSSLLHWGFPWFSDRYVRSLLSSDLGRRVQS